LRKEAADPPRKLFCVDLLVECQLGPAAEIGEQLPDHLLAGA
jgi:hypothetical protein